jgi:hypothetical protein
MTGAKIIASYVSNPVIQKPAGLTLEKTDQIREQSRKNI